MSRALKVVARLRKLAIDEARLELAARRAAEQLAEAAERAARTAIDQEQRLAAALDAQDAAFAAWVPGGLTARDLARDASTQAREAAQEGRATLAAARASAEAVGKMLASIEAERVAELNRREQLVLDEAGRKRNS